MSESENRNALFEKYLSGACTSEEIEFLVGQFGADADEGALRHLIQQVLLNDDQINPLLEARVAEMTQKVASQLADKIAPVKPSPHAAPVRHRLFRRWQAVAAMLIGFVSVGVGGYFLVDRGAEQAEQLTSEYGGEVMPGGNRATLTLADGRTVELSVDQSGIVIGNGITYDDGTSVLEMTGSVRDKNKIRHAPNGADLMTISTPKGGQYQISLPDGSKVWLNSASTLKYPAKFDHGERVVVLEGEAYFEVAPLEFPFRVKTKTQTVEVLGTQFNISAYADDRETKTTLVGGSVKVANAQQTESKWLIPSQQSVLRDDKLSVREVDVAQYIDWKDGLFSFQETSLPDAMAQLSRWYDVEITYDQSVSLIYFFGKIRRDNSLSNVLNILRKSGLNFRIESEGDENRLFVLPQMTKDK